MVLFVMASWLFVRAKRTQDEDRRLVSVYVAKLGARYTLRVRAAKFVVCVAPPHSPATLEEGTARTRTYAGRWEHLQGTSATWIPRCTALPQQLTAEMRNDDVLWEVCRSNALWTYPPKPKDSLHFSPRGRIGSATNRLAPRGPAVEDVDEMSVPPQEFPRWRLPPYTLPQVARLLLAALEDENRWIAAHVALDWIARADLRFGGLPSTHVVPQPTSLTPLDPDPSDRFACSVDGLSAELHAIGESWAFKPTDEDIGGRVRNCNATIDPALRRTLIEQWHNRLDVTLGAISIWQVIAGSVIAPSMLAIRHVHRSLRRHRRIQSHRCVFCGYDLRASSQTCPECGSQIEEVRGSERGHNEERNL